jgi:hypothetical protein
MPKYLLPYYLIEFVTVNLYIQIYLSHKTKGLSSRKGFISAQQEFQP